MTWIPSCNKPIPTLDEMRTWIKEGPVGVMISCLNYLFTFEKPVVLMSSLLNFKLEKTNYLKITLFSFAEKKDLR